MNEHGSNDNYSRKQSQTPGKLPIGKNEDVEFSETLADENDKEAEQRAAEADKRAEQE
ncbi:YfhD family protein [Paenibacillus sepulcri]|uniref:YfhD family protein n=1 Tax=Paenibacillus sepulcri TaxID=359917 RepID=A0ABS7C1H0_9BACL|nr:YfhD family protein [Paenibacillus sepulcri]